MSKVFDLRTRRADGLLLLVAALALVLQGALEFRLRKLEPAWEAQQEEEPVRWSPDLFKAITFGHWASGIDLLWLETVLDPSVSHVAQGKHPAVFYNMDLATDLDPAYYDIYVDGANLLAVIRDDAPGALSLLLKGDRFRRQQLASYPEAFRQEYWRTEWDIPLLLGYVYLFEMGDMKNAAEQFEAAALLPGAPAYLLRLSERLRKPGGQYEVGLKLLDFMISTSKDERARERLRREKASLAVGRYLYESNRAFDEYRAAKPRLELSKAWREFLARQGNSQGRDPFGGTLSLDGGKVVSSTPHERVFGLD